MSNAPAISCVVPVYNEQATVQTCYARIAAMLDGLTGHQPQELIFVNDGSEDLTQAMLHEIAGRDPRVVAIRLTRNFGHQAAVSIGLQHARGAMVCVLDGDLQDPPEVVPNMIQAIEDGADVAYGIRQHRKEHPLKKIAYAGFYRVMRAISDVNIPLDAGDFCVMRSHIVSRMNRLPESQRFVRGLRAWVGGTQTGVPYERHERHAGLSKYSLRKLLGLAAQGVFSFSSVPVKLVQLLGFGISAMAILVALSYLTLFAISPAYFPPGWATLVISIWFLAGLQMLSIGLLGEYVHRSFTEIRQRPTALVADVTIHDNSTVPLPCNTITPDNTHDYIVSTGGGAAANSRWSKPSAA
ncbi:MAG: glycosyltransferase family 2 protein [Phycisphaeraceae bacterium]|nr:glycosyltransferase family 2 protein [Phycisphaeraceae bacterium]